MAGKILKQLIRHLNAFDFSAILYTNKEIAWLPVIRQIVGKGANRFAKFGRIVRGNGTLHIIGLYVCQQRLDCFIGHRGASPLASNSASL